MFGIPDPWIWGVYVLCILSAVLCVVYGALNWNKGKEVELPSKEDKSWAREEDQISEQL